MNERVVITLNSDLISMQNNQYCINGKWFAVRLELCTENFLFFIQVSSSTAP